jgi:hypothetical protein
MCIEKLPVYEDLITLGDDAVDLEVRVGERRHEALVVSDARGFVQHGHAGVFPCIVVSQLRRLPAQVSGIERFYYGQGDLLILFCRHEMLPLPEPTHTSHMMTSTDAHRI